jgi:hypothetical protein
VKSPVLISVIDENRGIYKGFIADITAVCLLVKSILAAFRIVVVDVFQSLLEGLIPFA